MSEMMISSVDIEVDSDLEVNAGGPETGKQSIDIKHQWLRELPKYLSWKEILRELLQNVSWMEILRELLKNLSWKEILRELLKNVSWKEIQQELLQHVLVPYTIKGQAKYDKKADKIMRHTKKIIDDIHNPSASHDQESLSVQTDLVLQASLSPDTAHPPTTQLPSENSSLLVPNYNQPSSETLSESSSDDSEVISLHSAHTEENTGVNNESSTNSCSMPPIECTSASIVPYDQSLQTENIIDNEGSNQNSTTPAINFGAGQSPHDEPQESEEIDNKSSNCSSTIPSLTSSSDNQDFVACQDNCKPQENTGAIDNGGCNHSCTMLCIRSSDDENFIAPQDEPQENTRIICTIPHVRSSDFIEHQLPQDEPQENTDIIDNEESNHSHTTPLNNGSSVDDNDLIARITCQSPQDKPQEDKGNAYEGSNHVHSCTTLPPQSQCTALTSMSGVLQSTIEKQRAVALKNSRSVECDNGFPVNCDNSQHSSLILDGKLHLLKQSSPAGNNACTLKTFNLLYHKENSQDINLVNKHFFAAAFYKIFSFCNLLSLLIGKLDYKTWKLNLYQLDHTKATCATWKQVAFSKYSISDSLFDFQNCIPVSHREDKVILVSVLNDRVKTNHCIIFHIFSQRVSGRNWKTTSSLLPIQYTRTTEYQIQSCIIAEINYIYCSVLLHGIGAYIYKFDLMLLQQHQKSSSTIRPICSWHIRDPTLESCFLSSLQEEVVIINFKTINDKGVMEVRRPKNFLSVLPADYQYECPCEIEVIATSIVSASKIFVMYHDIKCNKCFIKAFTI